MRYPFLRAWTSARHIVLTDKERKLQRHRRRMTRLSIVNWSLQSLVVGLFAWDGQVSWSQMAAATALGLGPAAAYYLLIATHLNLRMAEPGLLMPQLLSGFAVQLVLIVMLPKLWLLFLLGILCAYNFAMLSFTPRQFTRTWIGLGAGIAAAMYLSRDKLGFPEPGALSMGLFWLMFVASLSRLSVIGAQFSGLRQQLSQKNRLLSESLAQIERLASHDDLTGAYNRRSFMTLMAEEQNRATRSGRSFCVVMFDLDQFKSINDRFGHAIGDEVLRRFSDLVRARMRSTDRFGRYGGEEFGLLLSGTSLEEAGPAVHRICKAVAQAHWAQLAPALKVTVSAGLACYREAESADTLLDRAEQALLDAKRRGRDRCVVAD